MKKVEQIKTKQKRKENNWEYNLMTQN